MEIGLNVCTYIHCCSRQLQNIGNICMANAKTSDWKSFFQDSSYWWTSSFYQFQLVMLDFYYLVAPSYLVICFICCFISRVARGKFQGKWLSIFSSVRYAPADNFSLLLFNKSNLSKTKIRNSATYFLTCFCPPRLVTLFSEKGSLVVKTTLTEHFFRWGAFCEKFVGAEGSLWLSKQQLNFHQNTSLPEEGSTSGTTKSFPLFYIEDRKGENQIKAENHSKNSEHRHSFALNIINQRWNIISEKKRVMFPCCSHWILCVKMIKKLCQRNPPIRRRNPPIPSSSFLCPFSNLSEQRTSHVSLW